MKVTIHDAVEQNTEAWLALRFGKPTASNFKRVLAKGEGKVRNEYMRKLVGERITGQQMNEYRDPTMDRGQKMEPEARSLYSMLEEVEIKRVGFVDAGFAGASPDGFIGLDGVVEFKTAFPHILAEYILADRFVSDHRAQCQGALWLSQREWVDLVVYWPGMPLFIKREHRDDVYITTLASEVDRFCEELDMMEYRIRRYGKPLALVVDNTDLMAKLQASVDAL
jgi:hypothetical protein